MNVFRVANNREYKQLNIDDEDDFGVVSSHFDRPSEDFTCPTFYDFTPKLPLGNFVGFLHTILIFDETACSVLKDSVESAGQRYPVQVEDIGQLNILYVREKCDPINVESSTWSMEIDGEKVGLIEPEFHGDLIKSKSGLFRIKSDRYSQLYAVTGCQNQEFDFYADYQEANLTGLSFVPVWSDE